MSEINKSFAMVVVDGQEAHEVKELASSQHAQGANGYVRKGIENTKDYLSSGLALASLMQSETLRAFILETNQFLMGRDKPLAEKMASLESLLHDFTPGPDSSDEDKALYSAIGVFLKRGEAILAYRQQRRESKVLRERLEQFSLAARVHYKSR